MSHEEIVKIKERYTSYLMNITGVVGVGVRPGNGSIIIYVERLTPKLRSFLPTDLDGIPVLIVESGKIVPLSLLSLNDYMPSQEEEPKPMRSPVPVAAAIYAERTGRFRPAPGGISCGHPCYDKETRVLTEDGLRYFSELALDDKIATLNSNGELEYQQPNEIFEFNYEGEMIHFQGSLIDLMVTPNHKIYYRWTRKGKFKLEEAKEVLKHYYKEIEFKRDAKWNCTNVSEFSLPLYGKSKAYEELANRTGTLTQFAKEHSIDYRTARRWNKGETKPLPLYSKQTFNMDDWIQLLGWYLCEGSLSNDTICLSEKSGKYHVKIKSLLDRMRLSYCVDATGNIRISHQMLAKYLRKFGHAKEKYIPKEIKSLPPKKLGVLLETLIEGDGRFEKGRYRYFKTSSKKFAEDVLEVGLKCGYGVTLTSEVSKSHKIDARTIKGGLAYRVGFSHFKLTPIVAHKPKSLPYKDKIYCIAVPNHIIFVERNGKTCWSGNSITAGTLSCRAIDKTTKEVLGLTNNHVGALQWGTEHVGKIGDSMLQPGPYDGGVDPDDKIGELSRWVDVKEAEDNLVDIAAFRSDLLKEELFELGKPDRLADAYPGMKLVKSGRTSGVTYGQIIDCNATIKVNGWGEVTFVDQITVQPAILQPGDSGSWCGQDGTFKTVGIGHAGSPDISVVCKAKHVEDLLNVEVVPPISYMPWYTALGLWASIFAGSKVLLGGGM